MKALLALPFLFITLPAFSQTPEMHLGTKPAGFDAVQNPPDTPPRLNGGLDIAYPDSLVRRGVGGIVHVAAALDDRGTVIYAEISHHSRSRVLDSIALAAVFVGDFKPAKRDGKPVASRLTVPVEFRTTMDAYQSERSDEQLQEEQRALEKQKRAVEDEQKKLDEEMRRLKEKIRK